MRARVGRWAWAVTWLESLWLRRRLRRDLDRFPFTDNVEADDLRMRAALADERWSFRTVEGIASQVRLSDDEVRAILDQDPDWARRSILTDRQGRPLYTAAERALTPRERIERIRWLLAR